MNNQPILDQYTFFSYKGSWSEGGANQWKPGWVGRDAWRRLQAYQVLEAYYRNASRHHMTTIDENLKNERREYGDPFLIVNQTVASVLGQGGLTLHVDGAEKTAREGGAAPSGPDALLDDLNDWATKERFWIKTVEGERNCSKLGDNVYVLGWSNKRNRAVLNVWDPGFYFPVWEADGSDDEGLTEEFPSRVHIAYEFERTDRDGSRKVFVRRITWELAGYDNGRTLNLPWRDTPSDVTCWYSDGVWPLDEVNTSEDPDDFDERKAAWRVQDQDLGLDFIPVVHVPNYVAEQEQWGLSSIAMVMQILDDLQATDTDLQKASALTGTPPIALNGGNAPKDEHGNILSYGPGTVWETGDGSMTAVDTSRGLEVLTNYDKHLLERLSVNSRIPEAMMGRIKPSEVPSGIALWLSFAPHSTMIEEMRMVRAEKYALLLKFVVRWHMAHEVWQVADPSAAPFVRFGSYLPADKSEAMTMVTAAMNASTKPISVGTAVRVLLDAGFPIDDVATEVAAIQKEDFDGASMLATAVGDPNAARTYLGMPEVTPADMGITFDELGNPIIPDAFLGGGGQPNANGSQPTFTGL